MALVFIDSVSADEAGTGSGESTLSFTSGIDNSYSEYQFYFVNMHPQTNGKNWEFQVNAIEADSTQLTGFNEVITSTVFRSYLSEEGNYGNLEYRASQDQGNGVAHQQMSDWTGNNTDSGLSGILTLYDPSSATYMKHFVANTVDQYDATSLSTWWVGGYINTTNAINQISFRFEAGNIDYGTIYMYGVG